MQDADLSSLVGLEPFYTLQSLGNDAALTDTQQQLAARIAKTAYNRDLLLRVLDTPALPLHNNDMELAARRRVRKRDVRFGPQSRAGAWARDTFQTIAGTAAKQGVRLHHYLCERLLHPDTTPSLVERIAQRSCTPALNPA